MIYIIKRAICLVFLLSFTTLNAQKGYELGGWLGVSHYFGDLNTNQRIGKPGLAFGVAARYNFDTRISVRTSFNYGRVRATDTDSQNNFERNRNLSFRSDIVDMTNVLEFNFFHYEHGSKTHNKTPYLFGGFNFMYFNPKAELDGTIYNLRKLGTEGQTPGGEYGSLSGGLVLGGGYKWDVTHTTSINLEFSMRFLFTDYLDDVSTVYPDKTQLGADRGPAAVALSDRSLIEGLGAANRQRGDKQGNDNFTFFGIGVMRYFGGIECPEISKPKWK